MKKTFQEENWSGEHGNLYNVRNPHFASDLDDLYLSNFGVSRKELNQEFLGNLPREMKILEVGCNVGAQLHALQQMGFLNLCGIDINRQSLEVAKKNLMGIDTLFGSALDLPFKDGYFDLVFTSGVLIHISPDDVKKAMSEIARVSQKYIWGFEYFNPNHQEVEYRGKSNLLWKANFSKLYLDSVPNLKLVQERKLKYQDNENVDIMFLLEKI